MRTAELLRAAQTSAIGLLFAAQAWAGGNIVITGHDSDNHGNFSASAQAQVDDMVRFARAGSPNPHLKILLFDHGTELVTTIRYQPNGNQDPTGRPLQPCIQGQLTDCFDVVDPDAGVPAQSLFDATVYSAIGIASDASCGGCDNTTTSSQNLAAAGAYFRAFVNAGGGVFAFAGADNPNYYNFLPASVSLVGHPGRSPYTQTAVGAMLGIRAQNGDFSHNLFPKPGTDGVDPAWLVVETYTGPDVVHPGTHFVAQPITLAIQGASLCAGGSCGVTSCPVSPATVNVPYSSTLTTYGPLTLPLRIWTINTAIPGLSLDSEDGILHGTPLVAGTYNYVVTVLDATYPQAQTVNRSCTLVVNPGQTPPPPTPLAIAATCPAVSFAAGAPFSLPLTGSGGNGTYVWTVSGQSWLSIATGTNTSSATLSGVTPGPGTYSFTVTLNDTAQTQPAATFTCALTVAAQVISVTGTCPVGSPNVPLSVPLTAIGGTGVYTIALSGPSWLSLSTTQGSASTSGSLSFSLSGIPPDGGNFGVTVTVTDSNGNTGVYRCGIFVPSPIVKITSVCPAPSIPLGYSYNYALSSTAGNSAIWTVAVGGLPTGLSLTRDGRIFGTPIGPAGTSTFTIGAYSGFSTDQLTCSINVVSTALRLTSGCPADATQGIAYAPFTFVAAGGTPPGPYTFSILNGALPAGLTLNGSTISGTPQGPPGSFTYTLQISNGNSAAITVPCTIKVVAPAFSISGTCPASVVAGGTVSTPVTVLGGKAPYTLTFAGSPYLSLINGTVTGTPIAAGSGTFSVTVRDSANAPPQTFLCNFAVGPPAVLSIGASCPASAITAGSAFVLPLAALGGVGPYTWSVSGPSWLRLSAPNGATVSLLGTPPASGAFPFSVTLKDNAGGPAATFQCSLTVNPAPLSPLQINPSGSCPTEPLAFQSPFTLTLTATGGTAPYTFTLTGPAWLALSSATGSSTTVSGTVPSATSQAFTVTLADSANTTPATFSCTLAITPPTIPPVTVTTTPPNGFLTPVTVGLSLGAPSPVTLQGMVKLTFTPSGSNPIDNPQVHFSDPCLRLCSFTIPAGTTAIVLPTVEQGTVAGTIHVEVIQLLDGTRNVLPATHPSVDITVPLLKPAITAMTFENETTNGFDIVISGYSTPRDMTSATITFAASSGATLQGDVTFTVSLSNLFTSFYQSPNSTAGGSTFEGLRIPISITGDKTVIGSVTVTLTNSVGPSDPVTKSR